MSQRSFIYLYTYGHHKSLHAFPPHMSRLFFQWGYEDEHLPAIGSDEVGELFELPDVSD